MGAELVHIDGSQGEGGGQILRSALALSASTGRPFRITGIRAGRAKPGLMRQHLTCVTAAQTICGAEVTGAQVGSEALEFRPGPVRGGNYTFTIGTAGSTTLVMQAILPPLLTAAEPSVIVVEGGTHTKAAPPYEFFERAPVPLLNRLGPRVTTTLERYGFYPAGGGRIVVEIRPVRTLTPIHLRERGEAVSRRTVVHLSQLAFAIAERELDIVRSRLGWDVGPHDVLQPTPSFGPGNAVVLEVVSSGVTEVFGAVGELGKTAERVASEAVDGARDYLASEVPVGPHLADQLMVPFALSRGGSFLTMPLTSHARTNEYVIRSFIPAKLSSEGGRRVVWSID